MRTPTSLSLLALLATAGSVIAQNDTDDLPFDIDFDIPEFPEFQCAEGLQVFISRGTGEEQGPGESGKLGEAIADRIPGTNITSNPYPATFDDPIYFESVLFGTLALGVMLTAYVTACPDSKIAVIGYSQGAQVTTNNFCGSPTIWGGNEPLPRDAVEKSVVAIALFGDPTFKADDEFSRGTGQGNGLFHRNNNTACEDLGDRIVSFCDAGDPYCDLSTAAEEDVHQTYLDRYADDVLEWIVQRYETGEGAFPGSSPGGNDTASATSSAAEEGASETDVPDGAAMVGPGLLVAVAASLFAVGLM